MHMWRNESSICSHRVAPCPRLPPTGIVAGYPCCKACTDPGGMVHSCGLRKPGWGPSVCRASAKPPHALCFWASLNASHMPLSTPGQPHQLLLKLQPSSTALLENHLPRLSFPLCGRRGCIWGPGQPQNQPSGSVAAWMLRPSVSPGPREGGQHRVKCAVGATGLEQGPEEVALPGVRGGGGERVQAE